MTLKAAVLGLGARGSAWAQLGLDCGWDMRGFDPNLEAGSWPKHVSRAGAISSAVKGVDWVFSCLPERLELVQTVLRRAQSEARNNTVFLVASTTYDIDAIQACAIRPETVFRLSEQGDGVLGFDLTARNSDLSQQMVESRLPEMSAAYALKLQDTISAQNFNAESA